MILFTIALLLLATCVIFIGVLATKFEARIDITKDRKVILWYTCKDAEGLKTRAYVTLFKL